MTIEKLWSAACSGDLKTLKQHYENGGEKNIKYNAFNQTHSLIAGAYRNGQIDTVDYLFGVGETILDHEQAEIKRTIMLWKDDFINDKVWYTICCILNIPTETETLELRVNVITHLSYKK